MYFITDQINKTLENMEQIGKDDSGWIIYYKDKNTKIIWEEIIVDDRSFTEILKQKNFPNTVKEIMDLCFASNEIDDWKGMGLLFSLGKYSYTDIELYLSNKNNAIPKDKSQIFSINFKPIDIRELMGKNYEEVSKSYEEYKKTINNIYQLCRNK